jgi:D-sedoheptulose 7-phosphate isomerase
MNFSETFLSETAEIARRIDKTAVERLAELLRRTREEGGRLFILGVGGSAANASHAANDFRKLAGIEAYAPTDNVSELTARTNDEGWESVFEGWLRVSRLSSRDCVLVLSVGGGDEERGISMNLVAALRLARKRDARTGGIVGRAEGATAKMADACVIVPEVSSDRLTPHAEAFQAVVWHLLVSHPALRTSSGKWESLRAGSQL